MSTDGRPTPTTRASDDPRQAARIREARNEGRKRTIFMSIIASGLVSLFIGYAIEVSGSNAQVDRSRKNCENINHVVEIGLLGPLDRQVDQTLGNAKKDIKPFKIKGTAFEDFEPLIVAQAHQAQRDAKDVRGLLADCEEVFKKRSPILFFG